MRGSKPTVSVVFHRRRSRISLGLCAQRRRLLVGLFISFFVGLIGLFPTLLLENTTNTDLLHLTSDIDPKLLNGTFSKKTTLKSEAIQSTFYQIASRHQVPYYETSSWALNKSQLECDTVIPRLVKLQQKLGLRKDRGNEFFTRSELLDLESTNQTPLQHKEIDHPQIVVTDFDWLQPGTSDQLPRYIWETLMLESIQNHPWYNPTGWAHITNDNSSVIDDVSATYYIFLDTTTFLELHWPYYNTKGKTVVGNCTGQRSFRPRVAKNLCDYVQQVLALPVFQNGSTHSRLIVFQQRSTCINQMIKGPDRNNIVLVDSSTKPSLLNLGVDMGMPPLAPNPVLLEEHERESIASCQADLNQTIRPLLLSFRGVPWPWAPVRSKLVELGYQRSDVYAFGQSAPKGKLHSTHNQWIQVRNAKRLNKARYSYRSLLTNAKFSAAPRGDQLYSYRFTEILSAGAIPVVYSDGWVLPYTKELVDWRDYMVVIAENQVNQTFDILSRISPERRCRMRQKGQDMYQKYMSSTGALLQGVLDVLEIRRQKLYNGKPLTSPLDYNPYHECYFRFKDTVEAEQCWQKPQPQFDFNEDFR